VLPHAREKLEWCASQGLRTFVLTSMDTDAFERQMDDFGFRDLFEATYSGVLDKREIIHQILETHLLIPTETVFIGDMTHDVETAHHGGVSSIAVLTGYHHPEILASVRPDLTVPDLGVLRALLARRHPVSRPISTVGALIHDGNGRVLMIRTHKWSNLWGIPGGKIKRGEASITALRREILEETALEIDHIQFTLVQDCINSPEFMRPEHFILLNYTAEARSTAVQLNDEAEEFRWLPPTEALELDLNQPTRTLLVEALKQNLIPHAGT
jgi:phosphoglycolate phosphatase